MSTIHTEGSVRPVTSLPPSQVLTVAARVTSTVGADRTPAGVRRRPVQRRGIETLNLILDAAQALLDEHGLEGFTTNTIAERANVNIATLYGYFEGKLAILGELATRDEQRRAAALQSLAETYAGGDWSSMLDAVIDQLVQVRLDHPSGIALRVALAATPELRPLGVQRDERLTELLADVLRMFRPDLSHDVARRAAAPVVASGSPVLDRAVEGGTVDTELVEGYRQMVFAHLARVLD